MQLLDLELLLQQTYVFGWLPSARLQALERVCSVHVCQPGDTVVKRGEPADGWRLVYSGNARAIAAASRASGPDHVIVKGDVLGARALIDPFVWPTTVRADSSVTLLHLSRSAFESFQQSLDPADRAQLRHRVEAEPEFEFLRHLRIFAQVRVVDLEHLFDRLRHVRLARGEYLFHEDEPAGACYLVRSGRLQLLKDVDASRKHLATRREGDLVGEIELLYGTPRMAHAIAATDAQLFEVRKEVFDELIPEGRTREAIFKLATDRLLQYQNTLSEADRRAGDDRLPTLSVRWTNVGGGLFPRAYPFVAAESPLASGLACLAMIDRFHRRDSAWQERIEQLLWDRRPDTLLTLSRKAEECGYLTRVVTIESGQIGSVALPAIVEDGDGTLAVVFRADRRGAVVANPRGEIRTVARAALAESWRGRVLTMTYVPREPFWSLFRTYASSVAAIAIASLLMLAFALGAPLATKLIVDRVLVDGDRALLGLLVVGMGFLVAFRLMACVIREQVIAHATQRIALYLQVRFLDHILRLPYGATQHVGDFAVGFRENERVVELALKTGLPVAVDALAMTIYVAALVALSPRLALTALMFVAVYGVVALLFSPFVRKFGGRSIETRQAVEGHLIEAISSIQTIKALATEDLFISRGTRLMIKLKSQEFAAARLLANRELTGSALHLGAMVAILGYGATLALSGQATTGGVVASLGIVGATLVPLNRLLDVRGAGRQLRSSVETVQSVFRLDREESAATAVAPVVEGHLRLKGVAFRYPGTSDDVLSDVDLEILPGQKVAFVGRSGSGKTTLVNLLVGLYRPTRGTIYLDHLDITSLPKSALRRQFGVVDQHPFLFEGTIRDNIAKADPSVGLDRVVEVAKLAGAQEFIEALPKGYDTPIGERGARLSGGEKQRLIIARALVGNPRVLILDEATSALDSAAERIIHRQVDSLQAGRTLIMVAHRLSTVRDADLIVVLERGRVVETGVHAELMARRGLYYYLHTRTV